LQSIHFCLYFNRLALEAFRKLLIFKRLRDTSCLARLFSCGTLFWIQLHVADSSSPNARANRAASITVYSNSIKQGMVMDPYEIEDTSDWLGTPTPLEMYKHSCLMLENEVQELTTQLRKARQDIFGLIEMHAAEAKEAARLRAELKDAKREWNSEHLRYVELMNKSRSDYAARTALIAELYRRLKVYEGDSLPEYIITNNQPR
jgi:hypothetical protein